MRVESADRVEQDVESLHLDVLLRKTDAKATSAIRCLAPAGERGLIRVALRNLFLGLLAFLWKHRHKQLHGHIHANAD